MKKKTNNNFLIIDIVFAILTILVVISLFQNILLASFLLAIISAIYIYIKKSKTVFFIFLIGAIWGPISEILVISFSGAWFYSNPNVFGLIPFWLFFVWGNAAIFLYSISKYLDGLT